MENQPVKPVKIIDRILDVSTYKKYAVYILITVVGILVIVGGVSLWRWVFPKPDTQTNRPRVIVTPFAKVEKIDQTNTQIQLDEKPWEIGAGVGGVTYDNKVGGVVGVWIRRKW